MNMDGTTTFSTTNEPKCDLWRMNMCQQAFTPFCSGCIITRYSYYYTQNPKKEGDEK